MSRMMTIRFKGGMQIEAETGTFLIRTDQALDRGGGGSAPEPFDLFLASLATCAVAYVAQFCAGRKLSLEGMRLTQSWTRDDKGSLAGVRISIEVPPDFPEKYRTALLRAAGQCAVKRVLESPPAIETEVVVMP